MGQGVLRRGFLSVAVVVAADAAWHFVAATQGPADPFAFFGPTVNVTAKDRQRLDNGEAVVRILPGGDHDIAVFAAVSTKAGGDRLTAWVQRIEQLKRSAVVRAVGRFSDPPRLEDLDELSLTDDELDKIRTCRPRDCGVKLTASEMTALQRELAVGGGAWKARLQAAFRGVVLARVRAYLAGGHTALPMYDDGRTKRPLEASFAGIIQKSPYLVQRLPELTRRLQQFPRAPIENGETFFYWSTELFGGRPVTSATHVTILASDEPALPVVLVAGKQIMATHYMNGSLTITAILRGRPGGPNYLVTLNRSEVDVLGGFFGGFVRLVIERRVKSEASDLLQGLRNRLEAGPPGPALAYPDDGPGPTRRPG
jgi:hypothetical protein